MPARLEGGGLASYDGRVMTVEEIRTFSLNVPGSDDYLACDFRRGFINSGTKVPEDWKEIYIRFAAAEREKQLEFLDQLEHGAYREIWGAAE